MAADDINEQIVKYLTDVHSTEENAIKQLHAGVDAVDDEQLRTVLRDHLRETEEHERLIRARLDALEAGPSKLKDAAQKGVAAVGGALSGAAPDTTGKVAIQAFATEHLEIASYRCLRAVAQHAGDAATADLAERILVQEQAAAQKLDGVLEHAALVGLPPVLCGLNVTRLSDAVRPSQAVTRRGAAIGVVGAGRMGRPICARLAARGFDVTATDIDEAARAGVISAGAHWVGTVRELAERSRVVVTVLPGPDAVARVRTELLAALSPGSSWIDLSTSDPAVSRENDRIGADHGVRTLDAPMGGGPPEAATGRLVLFVGGAADVLQAQRALLDALAAQVLHVGTAPGSGCVVKLIVNLLWFGQAVAAAEALALAARAGLDGETVRRAVQQSAAAMRFMDRDASRLMSGDDLTAFSLAGCVDELRSVRALGEQLQVPPALAERVAELYAEALERYGDVDGEMLAARLVLDNAGVSLAPSPEPGRREADPDISV